MVEILAPEIAFESVSESPASRPVWGLVDVLLMAAIFLAMGVMGIVALRLGVRWAQGETVPQQPTLLASLGGLVLQVVASFVAVYGVGRWRHRYTWADLGFRPAGLGWWALAVLGGVVCLPLLGGIAALVAWLLGDKQMTNPQLPFLAPGGRFSWTGAIGMLLLAGVLAPIAEELYFRGVLFRWFRRRAGLYVSAGLSAFIFGLFHLQPMIAVAVMPLGFVAALVYEWSGSLWPSVVIHVVNNGLKILILYAILAAGFTPEDLQKMSRPDGASTTTRPAPAPAADDSTGHLGAPRVLSSPHV